MRHIRISISTGLIALAVFGCTANRNIPLPYSIADAMALPEYKSQLEGVDYYFGNQRHPRVEKSFGVKTTSQRSNTFARDNDISCARAFASAMLRLRSAALRAGGNAVINIKSNYKYDEVSSETQYQCASGTAISAVALKGEVVKLRK